MNNRADLTLPEEWYAEPMDSGLGHHSPWKVLAPARYGGRPHEVATYLSKSQALAVAHVFKALDVCQAILHNESRETVEAMARKVLEEADPQTKRCALCFQPAEGGELEQYDLEVAHASCVLKEEAERDERMGKRSLEVVR